MHAQLHDLYDLMLWKQFFAHSQPLLKHMPRLLTVMRMYQFKGYWDVHEAYTADTYILCCPLRLACPAVLHLLPLCTAFPLIYLSQCQHKLISIPTYKLAMMVDHESDYWPHFYYKQCRIANYKDTMVLRLHKCVLRQFWSCWPYEKL